jgi:hypothetical protein
MFNVILILTFIWGLGLRIWMMRASIDYDEAYSFLYYMRQPFWTAISHTTLPNNHLLNTFSGWVVQNLTAPVPWTLRFIPFILGLGSLYAVYLGLKTFFSDQVAKAASVLAWASYPFVIYSAMARGYIYQVFFIFLGLHFINQKKTWAAAFAWALAIWSIPLSLHVFIFCLVSLYFLKKITLPEAKSFLIKTGVVTFLLYLPALIYTVMFGININWQKPPWASEYFIDKFVQTYSYLWWPEAWYLFLIPLVLFLFRKEKSSEGLFLRIFSLFIVLMILQNRTLLMIERTWIWTVPLLAAFLLSSLEIVKLPERLRFVPLLIFLIPLSLSTTKRIYEYQINSARNIESLHRDLSEMMRPGDFLLSSQMTMTKLEYWTAVKEDKNLLNVQPFFIEGDWDFSLYRTQGPEKILRQKVGGSRFFAVIEDEKFASQVKPTVEKFSRRPAYSVNRDLKRFTPARLIEVVVH